MTITGFLFINHMPHSFFKTLGLFLLLLGSCGRVSKEDLAHLSGPIPLQESLKLAHAQEFFEEGGWPTERFWEMFEDPQLNAIVEKALVDEPYFKQGSCKSCPSRPRS